MVIPVEVREVIGRFSSNPEVLSPNFGANYSLLFLELYSTNSIFFSKKMNFKNS